MSQPNLPCLPPVTEATGVAPGEARIPVGGLCSLAASRLTALIDRVQTEQQSQPCFVGGETVALQRMGTAMQALLLRARDADAGTYLAAGCGVLDLIAELMRLTVLNELGRAEWAAGRPCSWRSRFFDSCVAVSGETMPVRMHAALEATAPAALGVPQQHASLSLGLAPFYSMA